MTVASGRTIAAGLAFLGLMAVGGTAKADSIVSWGWDDDGQVRDTPSGTGFTAIAQANGSPRHLSCPHAPAGSQRTRIANVMVKAVRRFAEHARINLISNRLAQSIGRRPVCAEISQRSRPIRCAPTSVRSSPLFVSEAIGSCQSDFCSAARVSRTCRTGCEFRNDCFSSTSSSCAARES